MNNIPPPAKAPPADAAKMKTEGNVCLGTGVGVGVMGAAGAAFLGAVCPICIVATPLLIGAGIVQHLRARRAANRMEGSLDKEKDKHD